MEDIINRGGGRLLLRLYNATPDEQLDAQSPVSVQVDGFTRILPPGGELALDPGESVTLPQRLYHEFWGQVGAGWVLVGEVSRVNDDARDTPINKTAFPVAELS
jgi:D-lyxose ketol-isomerase